MTSKVIHKFLSWRKSLKKLYTCIFAGLKYKFKGRFRAITLLLTVTLLFCFFTGERLYPATTPAGTVVSNAVVASFRTAPASTFTNHITNNIYVGTVTNLSILSISPPNTGTVKQGNFITFAHTISNYGNSTNAIQLITISSLGYSITNYLDTNSNGILEPAEPVITNDILIPPEQKVSIIVKETIPITFPQTIYTDTIAVTGTPKFVTNLAVTGTTDYVIILPPENKVIYILATDGIHNAVKLDGTEKLGDLDVSVHIRLLYPPQSGFVDMFYDVNRRPDGSTNINTTDTKVRMFKEQDKWVGIIPASDARIVDNARVQFMFEIDDAQFYRTVTPLTQAYTYVVRTYQYKEKANLLNTICYPLDDSKPKPTLLFKLDKPSSVKVVVYDIKGDKVRTLVDEYREAGVQPAVIWEGKNDAGKIVGAGLYFVSLQYDNYKEVFKVIVVK